ncbi:hypothetical protein [Corynebacterium gerontici]|uniref:Uncharacterized protein n=1 Tax=Corynebacterium gerontici TaxID=2079234 RepID=A0A3G6IXT8_9CORY|nr:hypothetical protein [Corynebacterium gerontici]AZA10591.1 hypothetical protein CGERO_01285 [Corynebacterium gerontici]
MQFGVCIAYILHLFALTQSPNFALISIVTALSGGLAAIAGINWDVIGQSFDCPELVHRFAVRDQIVNTIGIPTGMLLFALLAPQTHVAFYLIIALLAAAGLVSLLPRASPTEQFREVSG